MPDAVIFDFDGVLVESVNVKTEAFAALYGEYGEDVVRQVVEHHREHGGVSRYEKFRHYHSTFLGIELSEDEVEELAQRFSSLAEERVNAAPYVEGALEVLERYYPSIPLFVASGTPETELLRIVEKRGMHKFFRGVYGSPMRKADIIRRILNEHGFSAAKSIMVGDAMTDYLAAKETDVQFVGRLNDEHGGFPEGVIVMPTLRELPAYIERLGS
jgi:phosphoglycolate phosphatase-like HAD superfamily hydrolase